MTTEQITALLATIIGAPFLIKLVERWFESKNLKLQSGEKRDVDRDAREWDALKASLERERSIYSEVLAHEREQFATRLTEFERRLDTIQKEATAAHMKYWEERVQRERLQARVEYLESELNKTKESMK